MAFKLRNHVFDPPHNVPFNIFTFCVSIEVPTKQCTVSIIGSHRYAYSINCRWSLARYTAYPVGTGVGAELLEQLELSDRRRRADGALLRVLSTAAWRRRAAPLAAPLPPQTVLHWPVASTRTCLMTFPPGDITAWNTGDPARYRTRPECR